ncbi:MAG: tyrosine-type recombinase/integrase [Desulfobulbaceae bacterium]|nr:tyrosine-type recombinase/integrase [Desulfobulbaceae bacterium]
MKPFNSFLADIFEDYITYRHTLGFTDKNLRSLLRQFDRYVSEKEADWGMFIPLFFLDFRQSLTQEPRSVNLIVSAVRGFFDYLVRLELCTENPLRDIPARRQNSFIPFVFSQTQVDGLLNYIQASIRHSKDHFFHDFTNYTAIALLVRCGLRISEPIRLQPDHYRWREKTLYIEKTKFCKDRLIPLPEAAAQEIENYLSVRLRFLNGKKIPSLLIGKDDKALTTNQIYPLFRQAVTNLGLWEPRKIIGHTTFGAPTPHSFRHSFAINTLKRIREQGKSAQQALPVLAAYMGHRKYRYTALYLKVLEAGQRRALVDFTVARREDL